MSICIGNHISIGGGGGAAKPNGAPSNLILTSTSDTSILGTFIIGSTNQDGHYAYYSTDNTNWTKAINASAVMLDADNSFIITGLTANTLYYVKVCSYKGNYLSEFCTTQSVSTINLGAIPAEYLDASVAASYSLYKIESTYAGNCLKIRRSSDDTEQDIGFVGNHIDIDAIATFVGTGYGYVTTWYDQSGSSRNLVQATFISQPLFYFPTESVKFDGVNDYMKTANFTLNQPETAYLVVKRKKNTATEIFIDGKVEYTGRIYSTINTKLAFNTAYPNKYFSTTLELNRFKSVCAVFNSTSGVIQINNYTEATGDAGTNNMGGITIGCGGSLGGYSNSEFKEVVVRSTADDATLRASIKTYQMNSFNINNQNVIGVIGDSTVSVYAPFSAISTLVGGDRIYNDSATSGHKIAQQNTLFTAFRDNEQCRVVFLLIGHNDLGLGTILTDYQALVTQIRAITNVNCKIIMCTLIPSKSYSVSASWELLNTAIRGGANAITGADGYIDVANSILNNGSNGLKPEYSETGDDSHHENEAGRQVIANLWAAKLVELGY